MEAKQDLIEPLFTATQNYIKTNYELIQLKVLGKTATISGAFVSRSSFVIAFVMFIVIANIGIALWVGELLGKTYYGFFCVAGFYAIIGLIIYSLHNWIVKRVSNSIILNMLN